MSFKPLVSAAVISSTGDEAPIETGRVLHVVNGEHYAGAERVQDLLACKLPQFGFEAGIACLKAGKFSEVRRSQAPCYLTPMSSRCDMGPAKAIARIVREEGYDLIHTHTPRSALIGRLVSAMTDKPLVHHIHSPTTADSTQRRRDAVNAYIERKSIGHAAAVIAVSRSLADYAREQGVRPERVYVAPNGVPAWGPLSFRNTPTGTWTLGMIALFRPRKGLEVMLDSLAMLHAQGHAVKLRAIGGFETPQYQQEILRRVQVLGLTQSIEFTGFTQDVPAELSRLDMLVLPSLFGEGLPMVLLESMAAGVPVIATQVEGVPEAIRDGDDGLLAKPGDAADLANCIARVLHGEVHWPHLRSCAHRRQADRFTDDIMARRVAEVYRQVLTRGQRIKTFAPLRTKWGCN